MVNGNDVRIGGGEGGYAAIYSGRRFGLEAHPNLHAAKPHLSILGGGQSRVARVTRDATKRELKRAFDFQLSCFETVVGCSELGDSLAKVCED